MWGNFVPTKGKMKDCTKLELELEPASVRV